MIRIAATFCFLMTLLCPVLCLAEEGGACSDHARAGARNCEAMSVGALVVESSSPLALSPLLQSALDLASPVRPTTLGSHSWMHLVAWNRASAQPPPAATRQALLQTFLF